MSLCSMTHFDHQYQYIHIFYTPYKSMNSEPVCIAMRERTTIIELMNPHRQITLKNESSWDIFTIYRILRYHLACTCIYTDDTCTTLVQGTKIHVYSIIFFITIHAASIYIFALANLCTIYIYIYVIVWAKGKCVYIR